jgi:hypothetical protein
MAATQTIKKAKLTLETGDGQVIEMFVASFELNISQDAVPVQEIGQRFPTYLQGLQHTSGRFEAAGPVTFTMKSQFLTEHFHAVEWKCLWCGHVNPRDARYCGASDKHAKGCGVARPIAYEI